MKIRVRAEGFDLVKGVHQGLESKLETLDSMFPADTLYDVVLKKVHKEYKCEIKVQNGMDFVRAEELGSTVEFAISNAVETLKKRARKMKNLRIDRKRGAVKSELPAMRFKEEAEDSELLEILRRKDIEVSRMTEVDAILDMEALGHTFFVFRNMENDDKLGVIYKRAEGYGLLTVE